MQCIQVDDDIPILLPAVYCGFVRCGSERFTWWHYFLMDVLFDTNNNTCLK